MDDPEPSPSAPKRRIMREHQLQAKGVVPWATKAALDGPFQFMAFDSAAKQTDAQRTFGAARGITKATPDTVLFLPGRRPVWVELKWGSEKPDGDQLRMHAGLRALGHYVGVGWSVVDVFKVWKEAGVPMRPGALVAAIQYDGRVAAAIARLEGKTTAKHPSSRKPAPRYTAGKRMARRIYAG